ncbi:MAG TPA: hypothetical protein VKR32_14625 [Puia sp.]|nr:hypothetical protein [Puia sp.]
MKKPILSFVALLLSAGFCHAQGCVAIRSLTGYGEFAQLGISQSGTGWVMDINNRYFSAPKVFDGTLSKGADGLTIYENTTNLELTRILTNGWEFSFDVPFANNSIRSKIEHAAGDYHTTHAVGLGDVRFTVFKWLFKPDVSSRGNVQVGLGLKFPTGNYHSEDYFYEDPNDKTAQTLAPVNVAIQLGDGGTGITAQFNGYYFLNKDISLYGNFFYLMSPKDQNGVPSFPPGLLPASATTLYHETTNDVNSVPDTYTLRAGGNFLFGNLVGTAGFRFEGAPAHDLIGSDNGLRRVGHILSVEPGVQYKLKKSLLYFFVSVPVDRATVRTVPDERQAAITGTPTITSGHFASTLFYVGYSFGIK